MGRPPRRRTHVQGPEIRCPRCGGIAFLCIPGARTREEHDHLVAQLPASPELQRQVWIYCLDCPGGLRGFRPEPRPPARQPRPRRAGQGADIKLTI